MTVVNATDKTSTGTQNLGTVTVATGPFNTKTYADGRVTLPVATASGSINGKFDDENYYSGDGLINGLILNYYMNEESDGTGAVTRVNSATLAETASNFNLIDDDYGVGGSFVPSSATAIPAASFCAAPVADEHHLVWNPNDEPGGAIDFPPELRLQTMTLAAWVAIDTTGACVIISPWGASTWHKAWILSIGTSEDAKWNCYYDGSNGNIGAYSSTDGVNDQLNSDGLWRMVVTKVDPVNDIIAIKVMGAAPAVNTWVETAWAGNTINYHNDTQLFVCDDNTGSVLDGRLGPVMLWNRVLSDVEIDTVYNSGNGVLL